MLQFQRQMRPTQTFEAIAFWIFTLGSRSDWFIVAVSDRKIDGFESVFAFDMADLMNCQNAILIGVSLCGNWKRQDPHPTRATLLSKLFLGFALSRTSLIFLCDRWGRKYRTIKHWLTQTCFEGAKGISLSLQLSFIDWYLSLSFKKTQLFHQFSSIFRQ